MEGAFCRAGGLVGSRLGRSQCNWEGSELGGGVSGAPVFGASATALLCFPPGWVSLRSHWALPAQPRS